MGSSIGDWVSVHSLYGTGKMILSCLRLLTLQVTCIWSYCAQFISASYQMFVFENLHQLALHLKHLFLDDNI